MNKNTKLVLSISVLLVCIIGVPRVAAFFIPPPPPAGSPPTIHYVTEGADPVIGTSDQVIQTKVTVSIP